MFAEYYALLVELGELAPAPAPLPDISGIQPLVVPGLADAEEAGDDAAQLDLLRAEQAKLKEEYDRCVQCVGGDYVSWADLEGISRCLAAAGCWYR